MDFVSGLRSAIQDLLVPELKAIQVRLEHLEGGFARLEQRMDAHQTQNDQRFEALMQRMDAHQTQNNQRFEALMQRTSTLDGKMDVLIALVGELKDLSSLRARLEVVEREVADLRGRR